MMNVCQEGKHGLIRTSRSLRRIELKRKSRDERKALGLRAGRLWWAPVGLRGRLDHQVVKARKKS